MSTTTASERKFIFLTFRTSLSRFLIVTNTCLPDVTLDLDKNTWTSRGETLPINSRWQKQLSWSPNFPVGVFELDTIAGVQALVETVQLIDREYEIYLTDD